MVLKSKKMMIGAVFFTLFTTSLFAGSVKIPSFSNYVVDCAEVISETEEQQINSYCAKLENTTGIQIGVLTMPSLGGESIESFSIKVCDQWQLGQKDKDNGILLLLDNEGHNIRIDVGYGLEDKLTDAKCGLILRNVIIPQLREGNYSKGFLLGVQNLGGIASDDAELVSKQVSQGESSENGAVAFFFFLITLFMFMSIITSKNGLFKWILLNSLFGGRGRSRRRYYPPRTPPRNPTSGFGSSGFGPGGFGGDSSFHGGGGGHFGGGGASGHF